MKKIAIFQYDLSMGGIQKSLINLLNNGIDYQKYEVDLYLFSNNNFFKDNLPRQVNLIYLKPYSFICKIIPFKILYKFKRSNIDKEYDVAIDFNSYSMESAINSLKCSAKKHIIWCHNDVDKKYQDNIKYRILWNAFKKKYYLFDYVVAVSDGARLAFIKKTKFDSDKVIVIPNFIDDKEILRKANEMIDYDVDPNYYNLVSMGRLCHQKGIDLLLKEFSIVLEKRKDIRLYIIGSGEDEDKLIKMTNKLGIENNVIFLGGQRNPFPYLKLMDGFILMSRYEGQGMVLLEAKVLGLNIFIPTRLEAYITNITGTDNIKKSLLEAKKEPKVINSLDEYNKKIKTSIDNILKEK